MVVNRLDRIYCELKEAYNEIGKRKILLVGEQLYFPIEKRVEKNILIRLKNPYTLQMIYDKEREKDAIKILAEFLRKYGINPYDEHLEPQLISNCTVYTFIIRGKEPKQPMQKEPFLYGQYNLWEGIIYLLDENGKRLYDIFKNCSLRNVKSGEELLKEYVYKEGEKGKDLWGKTINIDKVKPWKIITNKYVEKEKKDLLTLYKAVIDGIALYKRDDKSKEILLYVAPGLEVRRLSSAHLNGNGGNGTLKFSHLKYLRIGETDKEVCLLAPSAVIEVNELTSIKMIQGKRLVINKAYRYSYEAKDKSKLPIKADDINLKMEMRYCNVECNKYEAKNKRARVYITNTDIRAKEVKIEEGVVGNVIIRPHPDVNKVYLLLKNVVVKDTKLELVNPIIFNSDLRNIENVKIRIDATKSLPYTYKEFKTLKHYVSLAHVEIQTKPNTKPIKLTHELYNKLLHALKQKSQNPSK